MTGRDPRRDAYVRQLLSDADRTSACSEERLQRLGERILGVAGHALREREPSQRTIWDYAERWSGMLLPIGTLTAIAAGMCMFVLSAQREPRSARPSSTRVALLAAATNRVSSQNLVDLLVSNDRAASVPAAGTR